MGEAADRKIDTQFIKELAELPGGNKIRACFTCRSCTASCPVNEVNEAFNPLMIIRKTLYGFKKEVLSADFIWLCTSCYACQERCPQDVNIADFMTLLKNMAVEEGFMPQGIRAQRDFVKGQGRIYPIDDFDNKKRVKAELPELPTGCDAVKKLFPHETGN